MKIGLNYLILQLWDFFLGTQARVRNSHGKRAISGRAIVIPLYLENCGTTIQWLFNAHCSESLHLGGACSCGCANMFQE